MQSICDLNQISPNAMRRQKGATLIFALLALIALMLSTLALVRSVDISTLLMGNLSFKQDATAASDQASKEAISWLTTNLAALKTDQTSEGYYANTVDSPDAPLDATGHQLPTNSNRSLIDWQDNDCEEFNSNSYSKCDIKPVKLSDEINGNTAKYVIFRMCNKSGDESTDSTIHCIKPPGAGTSTSDIKGDLNYQEPTRFGSAASPYYRIVVRVDGARNAVSYTETVVHF